MNLIARVMNLRTNFKERYRLHSDASNQYRNGIVHTYYQRLKSILWGTPFEISPHRFANTISFTKYFTDTLDNVPKSLAPDNYHRLLYVFGVISLELMDEIKAYRVDFSAHDANTTDCSDSLVHAIHAFHRFQGRSDVHYRFLSLTVEPDARQVVIAYADAARLHSFLTRTTAKEAS